MLKTIKQNFYFIALLILLFFLISNIELTFFLKQQSDATINAETAMILEHKINKIERDFSKVRLLEKDLLTRSTPESNQEHVALLNNIKQEINELEPNPKANITSDTIKLIKSQIKDYEENFNEIFQIKTNHRLSQTILESQYQAITSTILTTNDNELLKLQFTHSRFFKDYLEFRRNSEYKALGIILDAIEQKSMNKDLSSYTEVYRRLLQKDYETEQDIISLNSDFQEKSQNIVSSLDQTSKQVRTLYDREVNNFYKVRKMLLTLHFASIMVGIIFLITIIIILASRIIKPIRQLRDIVKTVKDGKIEARFLSDKNDEISQLGYAFNDMLNDLTKIQKQLKRKNRDLTSKDKEITSMLVRLEKANKGLMELDKKKDEFISVAAHELKTPLTSIKGFTQLMQDRRTSGNRKKREHYLKLINENTVRLYELVNDLVDSSRINLGKLKPDIKNDIKPEKIFKEIEDNSRIIMKQKGIRYEFNIKKPCQPISVDQSRLLQALRNIMINAIHFTPRGGKISMKLYAEDKYSVFEIKDTGKGIPKKSQKYIFSKFYQVDSSLKRKVQGSGLGLFITKGIIDLMHGKISFKSKENRGTTFYIKVPISEEHKK